MGLGYGSKIKVYKDGMILCTLHLMTVTDAVTRIYKVPHGQGRQHMQSLDLTPFPDSLCRS